MTSDPNVALLVMWLLGKTGVQLTIGDSFDYPKRLLLKGPILVGEALQGLTFKRVVVFLIALLGMVIVAELVLVLGSQGNKTETLKIHTSDNPISLPGAGSESTLRVMTLNLAHGRAEAANQLLVPKDNFRRNLGDVAEVLLREAPHILALQEADGPSFWSGNFDHIVELLKGAPYPHYIHGRQADGLGLSYGTAILSTMPISLGFSYRFDPAPPTPARGFVLSTIEWPSGSGHHIDVISIHLDFASQSVRNRQIDELLDWLPESENPLIVMGDFNNGWEDADSPVRRLVKELDLFAFDAESIRLATFPMFNTRLDWILVSNDLEIVSYQVLDDPISDHRAVIAELRLAKP